MIADDTNFDALAAEIRNDPDARASERENAIRHEIATAMEAGRVSKGWSLREFAREVGTSLSQVQRLLQRELGGSLTLWTLCRAADKLDLDVSVQVRPRASAAAKCGTVDARLLHRLRTHKAATERTDRVRHFGRVRRLYLDDWAPGPVSVEPQQKLAS